MKRVVTIFVLLMGLSACTYYTLVDTKRQTIGGAYSVSPQIEWSKHAYEGFELWTVDGPGLEQVRLYNNVSEGETLFTEASASKMKDKLPSFRADMRAGEVMEFVVDSLDRAGFSSVESANLRPAEFGTRPGFRFDLTLLSSDGLEMAGMAAGAVVNEKLQLILYTGAKAHYFPRYKDPVERLIASVELI